MIFFLLLLLPLNAFSASDCGRRYANLGIHEFEEGDLVRYAPGKTAKISEIRPDGTVEVVILSIEKGRRTFRYKVVPVKNLAREVDEVTADFSRFGQPGVKKWIIESGTELATKNGERGHVVAVYADGSVDMYVGPDGPVQYAQRFVSNYSVKDLIPSVEKFTVSGKDSAKVAFEAGDEILLPNGKPMVVGEVYADGSAWVHRNRPRRFGGFRRPRVPGVEREPDQMVQLSQVSKVVDSVKTDGREFPLAGKKKLTLQGRDDVLVGGKTVGRVDRLTNDGQVVVYEGPRGPTQYASRYNKLRALDEVVPEVDSVTMPAGTYKAMGNKAVKIEEGNKAVLKNGDVVEINRVFADGSLSVQYPSYGMRGEIPYQIVKAKDLAPEVSRIDRIWRDKQVSYYLKGSSEVGEGVVKEIYANGTVVIEIPGSQRERVLHISELR